METIEFIRGNKVIETLSVYRDGSDVCIRLGPEMPEEIAFGFGDSVAAAVVQMAIELKFFMRKEKWLKEGPILARFKSIDSPSARGKNCIDALMNLGKNCYSFPDWIPNLEA